MLASVCKWALSALLEALDEEARCCCGEEEDDCGDVEGIAVRRMALSHHPVARVERAADGWLSKKPLIRQRPGRSIARTAGVICRWRKPERNMVTAAGFCRCQRPGWRYETSQLMGRDREAASDLAAWGTQGTQCHVTAALGRACRVVGCVRWKNRGNRYSPLAMGSHRSCSLTSKS